MIIITCIFICSTYSYLPFKQTFLHVFPWNIFWCEWTKRKMCDRIVEIREFCLPLWEIIVTFVLPTLLSGKSRYCIDLARHSHWKIFILRWQHCQELKQFTELTRLECQGFVASIVTINILYTYAIICPLLDATNLLPLRGTNFIMVSFVISPSRILLIPIQNH